MSLRLYVGNYPRHFTKEDINNLFRDFNGIKLQKFCTKDDGKKCFSFFVCKDFDQLLSVIQTMHDKDVSGRKLKVRASDESLQEYVTLLLQGTSDDDGFESQSTSLAETTDDNSSYAPNTSFVKTGDDHNYDTKSEPLVLLQVIKQKNVVQKHNDQECYEEYKSEKYIRKRYNSTQSLGSNHSLKHNQHYYEEPKYKQENEEAHSYEDVSGKFENSPAESSNSSCHVQKHNRDCYKRQNSNQEYNENGRKFENCPTRSVSSNSMRQPNQRYEKPSYTQEYYEESNYTAPLLHSDRSNTYATNHKSNAASFRSDNYRQEYEEEHSYGDTSKFENSPTQSLNNSYHVQEHNQEYYKTSNSEQKYYEKGNARKFGNSPAQSSSSNSVRAQNQRFYEKPYCKQEYYEGNSSPAPSLHSYDGYAASSKSVASSRSSSYQKNSFHEEEDEEDDSEFTWLSITNFPFGTSIEEIYELFSDYDPIEIEMISNKPRWDRSLTEAHVCFCNRDVADNVILTFDNTTFNGRLILVTDVEDLTVMNELLEVFH